jgi:hypothetical protein
MGLLSPILALFSPQRQECRLFTSSLSVYPSDTREDSHEEEDISEQHKEAAEIFRSSEVEEKKLLLNLVLQNCQLQQKTPFW